jgi:glycogen operon protein
MLGAAWLVGVLAGAAEADLAYPPGTPSLGAHFDKTGTNILFRVRSARATKIDLYLYATHFGADEEAVVPLRKEPSSDVWSVTVPVAELRAKGITGPVYYGYRAWGPNWPFDPSWTKGSTAGFTKDVDADGNRFDPNKLLLDPYAAEISHDPGNPRNGDDTIYASGGTHRAQDSGRKAPKGIVLMPDATDVGASPTRPLREEIIYEVHLRGLTKMDPSIAEEDRGTYHGAAQKAGYLQSLGITVIEFLPVHEFDNDRNDVDPSRADYWGYDTLGFFAPDRRYARDKSPGGPTREFKAMVKAFHDRRIKVYLDVVFNHTGEGANFGPDQPDTAKLLSWRGFDNREYYELKNGNVFFYDDTGFGAGNFNCATQTVRDLILDSLRYWSQVMGVDGFRFDLAPVLGNTLDHQLPNKFLGFIFDKMAADNPLNRSVRELPVRPADGGPGVDLIAEPWTGTGEGQEQGNFPSGWAEWDDRFRDTFRRSQNRLGIRDVTPGDLATRIAGSRDLYQDDGRKPWHSINSLVEHDGPCLRDLYSFTSDDRKSGRLMWNQGGDPSLQRQACRNGFALPLLSIGTPMFTGGDEMYRTQFGNDNPYNIDSPKNYLNWSDIAAHQHHFDFARRVIAFRKAHPALRPADYFDGNDHNGNGLKDITWYRDDAVEPDNAYWGATDRHFLGYRIDGTEFHDPARSIYVGYNGWRLPVTITLPSPASGRAWYRAGDTAAWMEDQANFKDPGQEDRLNDRTYEMKERSILVLIEH